MSSWCVRKALYDDKNVYGNFVFSSLSKDSLIDITIHQNI